VTSPLFWGSELFCGVTQNGWWWIRVQLGLTAPPPPLDGDSLKLTPWCCHKHWLARLASLPICSPHRPYREIEAAVLNFSVSHWIRHFCAIRSLAGPFLDCDSLLIDREGVIVPFQYKEDDDQEAVPGRQRRRRSHSYNTVLDC